MQGSYSKVNPDWTSENTHCHLLFNHKVMGNQASLVPLITEIFTVTMRGTLGLHTYTMSGYWMQWRYDYLLWAIYIPGKYTLDCAPELKHNTAKPTKHTACHRNGWKMNRIACQWKKLYIFKSSYFKMSHRIGHIIHNGKMNILWMIYHYGNAQMLIGGMSHITCNFHTICS